MTGTKKKKKNSEKWDRPPFVYNKLAKNGSREVFKVCVGSCCEAAVQTEDWLSWLVGG